MNEKKPEIKSCPFCGGEASQWWTEDTEWIQCTKCACSTDVFAVNSGEALKHWNARSGFSQLDSVTSL